MFSLKICKLGNTFVRSFCLYLPMFISPIYVITSVAADSDIEEWCTKRLTYINIFVLFENSGSSINFFTWPFEILYGSLWQPLNISKLFYKLSWPCLLRWCRFAFSCTLNCNFNASAFYWWLFQQYISKICLEMIWSVKQTIIKLFYRYMLINIL